MAKKGKNDSESHELAGIFKALADPTRVEIFQFLCRRCSHVMVEDGDDTWMLAGPTAGEVCSAVSGSDKITAKISHHLKEMRLAGLIAVKRRGKNMICGVRREAVMRLRELLLTAEPDDVHGAIATDAMEHDQEPREADLAVLQRNGRLMAVSAE